MRQETRSEGAKTPRTTTAVKNKRGTKGAKPAAANGSDTPKSLEAMYERRRANLQELRERRFNNSIKELGDACGKAKTFMWQLLSGHRTISEQMAREIEEKLGIQQGALDQRRAFESPTTSIHVHIGEGVSAEYRMVPRKLLSNLKATADVKCGPIASYVFCPVPCSAETFVVVIESASAKELRLGECVFIDPDDVKPQHLKHYLVTHPTFEPNSAAIMQAEKVDAGKWWLRGAHDALVESKGYTIIGRAFHTCRPL